ncbi:MAG: hypothetical protein M3463_17585 [Verrucomicrobiota bacterium]|nr:hypothetical protein [Verrucomicrobiota bacterium]
MNPRLVHLIVLLAGFWHCGSAGAQEDAKQQTILRMFDALDQDEPPFGLPPQGREVARFKKWCQPLLAMKAPAVAPLLQLLHSEGSESVMLTAFIIWENRWQAGALELLMLLDSHDQRLREAAKGVVAGVYLGWDKDSRKSFGAIDLATLLAKLHAEHGKLSYTILQRANLRLLRDEEALAGKDSLIPEEWFDVPEFPAGTKLDDHAARHAALKHPLWLVRCRAVEEASRKKEPDILELALSDADARVVLRGCELIQEAARGGERLNWAALLKASPSLTKHADPRVRSLALGNCGEMSKLARADLAPEIIEDGLKDGEGSVRQAAVEAFYRTRPDVLSEVESRRVLEIARTDADIGVRCEAARSVNWKGTKGAKGELTKWLRTDKSRLVQFIRTCVEDATMVPR